MAKIVGIFLRPSDFLCLVHQVAVHHTGWLLQKCCSTSLEYIQSAAENFVLCQLFVCASSCLPPLYLLCQLCLRIWLWGLAYIEACRADSKLAERVANDCLAPHHVWWQEVNSNSLKVTGSLPERNVWLVWCAPKPGPDKRRSYLRLTRKHGRD